MAVLTSPDGVSLAKTKLFKGAWAVNVRQSATTAATAVVWALHNPSARTVYISRIDLRCFFDGTAAATLMKYEVVKATSVTTFSAGTVVTPVSKKTSLTASSVSRVLDTGLTTTGITAVQILGNLVMGRVTMTATNYQQAAFYLDFSTLTSDEIELATNEILAIRQTATSVIGDNIVGTVDGYEV
jgi:hypothetical protein